MPERSRRSPTSSDSDAREAQAIAATADGEIQAMKALFEANKGAVTQLLVAQTTLVDTSVSETRALAGKRAAGQP